MSDSGSGRPGVVRATGDGRRDVASLRVMSWLLIAALVPLTYFGWRLFWFQTDDAHIAFRYVSQSLRGNGYVWNAAPFRPVEGYTSFLWVALLDVVWRVTGVAPPAASNRLLLIFGYGTLGMTFWMALTRRLTARLESVRLPLAALALLAVVSNRTFLAWTSSGLETGMFNFFVVSWVAFAVCLRPATPRTVVALASAATLIALTRPDGLLFVAATVCLVVAWSLRRPSQRLKLLVSASPILLVVVHLIWRRRFYGLWVPNTYYAKIGAAWPEAGSRYLLSFVLEYAYWLWCGLALVALWRLLMSRADGPRRDRWLDRLPILMVAATVGLHVAYYTLIVGGDHFEYRILSYLVPLIAVSVVGLLGIVNAPPADTLAISLVSLLLSLPIPWVHWFATKDLTTRDETHVLAVRLAPEFPRPVRPYVEWFDDLQNWLIPRHIGMRHQEHKVFAEFMATYAQRRWSGAVGDYPVTIDGTPGVVFWNHPEINVMDASGLNDAIIARSPAVTVMFHKMAHDRQPPEGYLACFRQNIQWTANEFIIHPRQQPLTADDIRACEARPWLAETKSPPPQTAPAAAAPGPGWFVTQRDVVAAYRRHALEQVIQLFAIYPDITAFTIIARDTNIRIVPAGSAVRPLERRWLGGEVRIQVMGWSDPVWTITDILP